jgi:hypothetical protein
MEHEDSTSPSSVEPVATRSEEPTPEIPRLPGDVLRHMAQFFDPQTFGRVARTCRAVHFYLNGEAEARVLESMTCARALDSDPFPPAYETCFRGGKLHGVKVTHGSCNFDPDVAHMSEFLYIKGRKVSKTNTYGCRRIVLTKTYKRFYMTDQFGVATPRDLRHGPACESHDGLPWRTFIYDRGFPVDSISHMPGFPGGRVY